MSNYAIPAESSSRLFDYIKVLESALSNAQVLLATNPQSQLHRQVQKQFTQRLAQLQIFRPAADNYDLHL